MNRLPLTLLCIAAAACGGSAIEEPAALQRSAALHQNDGEHHRSGRDAVFAADAAHTALIQRLGPVEGLLRPMRGNALYVAADIDLLEGKQQIRAALEAANPDAAHTSLGRTLAGGDASADGRFGFTFGWLRRDVTAGDGSVATTYGTYVSTWARDDDDGEEPFRVTAYYTRVSLTPHIPTRDGFPFLLGGDGVGGIPHRGDLARQKRSLLRTDADFAAYSVAHGFSPSFPAFAAHFVMPFGRNFFFLIGNDEVTEFYAGTPPNVLIDWTPVWASSSESGDLGATIGKVVTTVINDDGSIDLSYSKYLTLWARQADGAWRFIADGGTVSPPPSN